MEKKSTLRAFARTRAKNLVKASKYFRVSCLVSKYHLSPLQLIVSEAKLLRK